MANHRYWRVFVQSSNNTNIVIGELQFRTSIGGAAQNGGTEIFNIQQSGFAATQAFDSNLTTGWAAQNVIPSWLGRDYGASSANWKDIVEVSITAHNSFVTLAPYLVEVQYSDDAQYWITKWHIFLTGWVAGVAKVSSPPTAGACTYWAVLGRVNQAHVAQRLAEVEFMATYGGADQATGGTAVQSSGGTAANAFDNNNATNWIGAVGERYDWIGYQFAAALFVKQFTLRASATGTEYNNAPTTVSLLYSNDGISWASYIDYQGLVWTTASQLITLRTGSDELLASGVRSQVLAGAFVDRLSVAGIRTEVLAGAPPGSIVVSSLRTQVLVKQVQPRLKTFPQIIG